MGKEGVHGLEGHTWGARTEKGVCTAKGGMYGIGRCARQRRGGA
jgi:hypothetical protein